MIISSKSWGMVQGKAIYLYRMENTSGAYVELTNYGAALVSAVVPDRFGESANVVLGFNRPESYLMDKCYLGATIGRYANRIANARFQLDGRLYQLDANDGIHSNHGGNNGFHKQVFDVEAGLEALSFTYCSKDGEGGYPGAVQVTIQYKWSEDNELLIGFHATTDKKTFANFTNHAYFNLSGGKRKIFDHLLHIPANVILETGPGYIPTGAVIPVGDRAFSGERIIDRMKGNRQKPEGLNTYYCLTGTNTDSVRLAALLKDPASGRKVEVFTSYPGVLLYTGDFLHSEPVGNQQAPYRPFDGLCLECQYFPDSPNHPQFPSTVLEAGGHYHEQISYKFGITA